MKTPVRPTSPKGKAAAERNARLEASLKRNIARRKAQARARQVPETQAESRPKPDDDRSD